MVCPADEALYGGQALRAFACIDLPAEGVPDLMKTAELPMEAGRARAKGGKLVS